MKIWSFTFAYYNFFYYQFFRICIYQFLIDTLQKTDAIVFPFWFLNHWWAPLSIETMINYCGFKVGIGNMPSTYLQCFHSKALENIRKSTLNSQKNWLIQVRKGRESFDWGNLIADDYSHPGLIKSWLGLS